MTTALSFPPVGSMANRLLDTRLITVLSLLFTILAVPWSMQEPHRLPLNVVGVGVGVMLLIRPVPLSPWVLRCVTGTTGLFTAYLALTARVPALAAAIAVCVALQVSCLRSRRQAWGQLLLLTGTWLVAAALTATDWQQVLDLSPTFAMLALVTAVMTQVRRRLDQLLALLHHQADHDPLTGLLNRQGLSRRLGQLQLTAGAAHAATNATGPAGGTDAGPESGPAVAAAALGVLVIDVDHFKAVNDRHGHLAGDEALMWLAGLLLGALPAPALLARFGGEEFLVVLPGTDAEKLARRAEHVRALVATTSASRTVALTVSIGAATGAPGADFELLVARADGRLYAAKQDGRNRVRLDPALVTAGAPGAMGS